MLSRVKAVIVYDGSKYFGFQKQKSTPHTVTHEIEKALSSLHIDSTVVGSGRTDAGVHATGQVIHFDIPEYWKDVNKLAINLNRKLTYIRFKHISFVHSDFHARFHAKQRIYRYIFKTTQPSVFEQQFVSYYPAFNSILLPKALNIFKGKHDFDYFRKTGTQTHTSIREIYQAKYIQRDNYHFIYFQANSFLRSQVRMMVDAAMQVSYNNLTLEALKAQLLCQEKSTTRLAPPQGLYLARVLY